MSQSPTDETPLFVSVVIPNRNGARSIGKCLASALASEYPSFEIIVVDDASTDGSAEICEGTTGIRLIRLKEHRGASAARNAGVREARGEAVFFTDADCLLSPGTLAEAARAFRQSPEAITGGTYTRVPHDSGFFSAFQSAFIHYSETRLSTPDYVATHAMVVGRKVFERTGGFQEDFLPILEDVEFSHRARQQGLKLRMEPGIQVSHIFNFSLMGSLSNAFRKSMYWTIYSIRNKDLMGDSGTASHELKAAVMSWPLWAGLAVLFAVTRAPEALVAALVVLGTGLFINRRFLGLLLVAGGPAFALMATIYYTAVYPLPVGLGGIAGLLKGYRP